MIRVVIVDDHALFRAGIIQLLEQTADIVVVGDAAGGEEALAMVVELDPDVVLMDLSMPGVDGSAATRQIHQVRPDVRVVVLSSYVDRVDVLGAMDAGAVGYLVKDARPDELLFGIRSAFDDGSPLAARAAREIVTAWRHSQDPGELTERERDVLVLLADGLPNKVIGQRLGIAEKTVKAHVTGIFQTLGVTDRTQAALWVQRHGLPAGQRERREQFRSDTAAGT
jgi:DNA-binding NarL/FixJ family response regulator